MESLLKFQGASRVGGALICAAAIAIATVSGPSSVQAADAVEAFYKGRTVELYVGTAAGGGYDIYARLIAEYIGRHLPGKPTVIVRNMPGAGHLTMTNFVYNKAPRDGSVVAIPQQVMAVEQAMGSKGPRYDARKFNWIGRAVSVVTVVYTWHTSKVKNIEDARKFQAVMGTTGASSPTNLYLKALNQLAGTKFKRIPGYRGSSRTELAMERGEVEGIVADWGSSRVRNAQWLKDKKLNILVQFGLARAPDLPNVPLVKDVGTTKGDKDVLEFFALGNAVGRSFLTTPDVPADRLAALRKAFLAAMSDPVLLASAKKRKMAIGPVLPGSEVRKLIDQTLGFSPEVVKMAAKIRNSK